MKKTRIIINSNFEMYKVNSMETAKKLYHHQFNREISKHRSKLRRLQNQKSDMIQARRTLLRTMSKEIKYLSTRIKEAEEKIETYNNLHEYLEESESNSE